MTELGKGKKRRKEGSKELNIWEAGREEGKEEGKK